MMSPLEIERDQLAELDKEALISIVLTLQQQVRQLQPDWKIGLLSSVMVGDMAALDVDFLAINASFVSRSLVKNLHRNGLQVMAWTVNETGGIQRAVARNCGPPGHRC